MPKSNSATMYKSTIFAPVGQQTIYKGELLEVVDGVSVKFKYKKPRSSRLAVKMVAWDDLISYSNTMISFKTPKAPVKYIKDSTVEYDKNGLAKVYDTESGETYFVKPECLDAVADDDSVQSEIKTVEKAKKPKEKPEKSGKDAKKK